MAADTVLGDFLDRLRAEVVVVSYNDESWITAEQMAGMLRDAGHDVRVLTTNGELLRELTLDPSRDYQPQARP